MTHYDDNNYSDNVIPLNFYLEDDKEMATFEYRSNTNTTKCKMPHIDLKLFLGELGSEFKSIVYESVMDIVINYTEYEIESWSFYKLRNGAFFVYPNFEEELIAIRKQDGSKIDLSFVTFSILITANALLKLYMSNVKHDDSMYIIDQIERIYEYIAEDRRYKIIAKLLLSF